MPRILQDDLSTYDKALEKFKTVEPGIESSFFKDALGGRTRTAFYSGIENDSLERSGLDSILQTFGPGKNDEIFAWIDLFESVSSARRSFTMLELGAGFGRWLVLASLAVRQMNMNKFLLIGVEAEPTHFKWMVQHFKDNEIPASNYKLIRAAVAGFDGTANFYSGCPDQWYGQCLAPESSKPTRFMEKLRRKIYRHIEKPMDTIVQTPVVSLKSLLQKEDFFDFIHMDIQGSELEAIESAIDLLPARVRKVHIGTHDKLTAGTKGRDVESELREVFSRLGWQSINDLPNQSTVDTRFGRIKTNDGIQTWLNPKFA